MAKSFVKALTLTAFNSNALNGNLQALNTGLPQACSIFKIINASNVALIISYDGINDHDVIPANSILSLDLQQDAAPTAFVCMMRKGTIIRGKSATGAGGVGTIYIGGYYQEA